MQWLSLSNCKSLYIDAVGICFDDEKLEVICTRFGVEIPLVASYINEANATDNDPANQKIDEHFFGCCRDRTTSCIL